MHVAYAMFFNPQQATPVALVSSGLHIRSENTHCLAVAHKLLGKTIARYDRKFSSQRHGATPV